MFDNVGWVGPCFGIMFIVGIIWDAFWESYRYNKKERERQERDAYYASLWTTVEPPPDDQDTKPHRTTWS